MADGKGPTIIQINYKFEMTRAEYEQGALGSASTIAASPGLRWKVWIVNDEAREAGGIYLFDDEASARAYIASPHIARVRSNPKIKDWNYKLFAVNEAPGLITHAPMGQPASAQA